MVCAAGTGRGRGGRWCAKTFFNWPCKSRFDVDTCENAWFWRQLGQSFGPLVEAELKSRNI